MDDVWKQSSKKTWCKTQVGPGSWIKMTRDKRLKNEPQVLLGHLEFWCLVGISSERSARKACYQLWVSREFLFSRIFRPSGITSLSLLIFFPRLFLTRSYRKGFETWEASGPGWAGLQFRKSRNQTSIPLNGFPFELQQIGKLEAFLIHNSSQVPHAFGITIFCGCKL